MFLIRASASSAMAGAARANSAAPASGSRHMVRKMRVMMLQPIAGCRGPILQHYRDDLMTETATGCGGVAPPHISPVGTTAQDTRMTVPSSLVASRTGDGLPDPALYPALFDGVLWRRAFAYLIDAVCIGAIA